MNYEELKDWCDEARRSVGREMDRLQEQQLTMGNHLQVLEAAGDLLGEMERQKDELEQKQQEIDRLNEELEQKQQEMADLRRQHEQETEALQRQLLEARNLRLEQERQHLEAEVHAKPLEIHNHFESGSSSQVFNDKVNGKFTKKQNDKNKSKKRWRKMVRKVL
jgi:chromosome segregation ATPase